MGVLFRVGNDQCDDAVEKDGQSTCDALATLHYHQTGSNESTHKTHKTFVRRADDHDWS